MSQITFVFQTAPHATSSGREGIDALLATSALTDDISVVFLAEGVAHLLSGQDTRAIRTKNYSPMIKLFDLYDIENVYVCQQSLDDLGLNDAEMVIQAKPCTLQELTAMMRASKKIVHF
ncbi:sulfurtransferase complex subunit TusC [Vibrio sp.]|uniref:Protein TusC homolog n=1 Tax=Vibrio viridaestus TaxID=2487322 RepID=A0A3N9TBR5_9VIBR|nr:sulfurtransferase complex subunit TusC [Vibrio viridaestus]MDC0612298.1 sulfurtransferase complex subunit TusC [Vibrio sp.]RQW61153.1 sulfurtransferase complex subunit TusC [Vibrio viridaestus]